LTSGGIDVTAIGVTGDAVAFVVSGTAPPLVMNERVAPGIELFEPLEVPEPEPVSLLLPLDGLVSFRGIGEASLRHQNKTTKNRAKAAPLRTVHLPGIGNCAFTKRVPVKKIAKNAASVAQM
jgi:hypothetical protein